MAWCLPLLPLQKNPSDFLKTTRKTTVLFFSPESSRPFAARFRMSETLLHRPRQRVPPEYRDLQKTPPPRVSKKGVLQQAFSTGSSRCVEEGRSFQKINTVQIAPIYASDHCSWATFQTHKPRRKQSVLRPEQPSSLSVTHRRQLSRVI